MNIFTKVISTTVKSGKRFIKILGWGDDDFRTPKEYAPFGTDANPIKGMSALMIQSAESGQYAIVGYINTSQLADVGEHRIYSTDADGAEQFFIWLKNDGTCQVGGTGDFLTRYNELETGFEQLKTDVNKLVTAFNGHVHSAAGGVGTPTPPTAVPTVIPVSSSSASIANAKISEIKTIAHTP